MTGRVVAKLDTCSGLSVVHADGLGVELRWATPGDARRSAQLIMAAADLAEIRPDRKRSA